MCHDLTQKYIYPITDNKTGILTVTTYDEGEKRTLAVQKHQRNILHYFMMCLVGLKNGFLFNSIHDGYTGLFGSVSALCIVYDVFLTKCGGGGKK